jgi:hypothetical protein
MKFITAIVAAAAFGVAETAATDLLRVTPMPAASLFPGSNYQIDINASTMSAAHGRDAYGRPIGMAAYLASRSRGVKKSSPDEEGGADVPIRDDRYFGSAWLGSPFLRQLQKQAGVFDLTSSMSSDNVADTSDENVVHTMKMTHIVKSSPWHTDVMFSDRKTSSHNDGGAIVEVPKQVGFYLLNDNPNAYFEINDDVEWCIPIVKGNFITFNGRKPHHTVIMNGHVDMLGPFDVFSAKGVDGTEDSVVGSIKPIVNAYINSDSEDGSQEQTVIMDLGSSSSSAPVAEDAEGRAYFGRWYESSSVKNHGYVFAYDAYGLPPCTDCQLKIGLSEELNTCTKKTFEDSTILLISDGLTYTADEEGKTGLQKQIFNSLNPFVAISLVVFFCNEDGEPVACSILQPATLMEEAEVDKVLYQDTEQQQTAEVGSTDESATDLGAAAGNALIWSFFAIGLSAVCVLLIND